MSLSRDQWDRLRAELVARVEDIAAALLPSGSRVGGKWLAGNVHDGPGRSLNLALSGPKAGQWYDHGGAPEGEKAGDLVRLHALRWGCPDAEAGERLWRELALDAATPRPPATKPAPRAKGGDGELVPARGVRADDGGWRWALERGLPGEDGGEPPVAHWVYLWADGTLAMIVLRYNRPTPQDPHGKEFRPLSPWLIDGEVRWKYRDAPGPLPLYRLPQLAERVVVCEGEKAADAAARLLPGWSTVSPAHGAKSPGRTDWAPLAGRQVIVWPDHDKPGAEFAAAVARLVPHARILDVPALAARIVWQLRHKDDAADVPALTDVEVVDVLDRDPPLVPLGQTPGHPAKPPTPPTPPAGPADDDDSESAQRARTYRRIVASIEHAIDTSGLRPNALNGWRRAAGGAADAGDDELQADFLHRWRLDGRAGERVIPDAWEKVVRDMRRARRAELVARHTGVSATDAGRDALRLWVRAVAVGAADSAERTVDVDFFVEVMRHWMWGVKRYALGLPVERELMVVLCGRQASGKTWAIEQLGAVWEELSLPITAAALTDDRQAQVLYRGLVARWDELEGAHKADVDALKRSITSKTIAFRNLYSNAIQERLRTCSFIASTNLPVRHVIKDPTGARRYVEIETPARCDWDALRTLDMAQVWRAVSEEDDAPIRSILPRLAEHQSHLVHQDLVCSWLTEETWESITIRPADAPAVRTLPPYSATRGLTMAELAERFGVWAARLRQATLPVQALGARLRQLGFPEPVRARASAGRPEGRYYTVPPDILNRTAPWMGGRSLDPPPDPALDGLPPDF